ncbi:MAG: reverse transcriptase/maturase family protein [Myxococcota bacterium]
MRRVGELWERLVSFENLHAAFLGASRGKRRRPDVLAFAPDVERRLFEIRDALEAGAYGFGPYRTFHVADTKRRLIMAAPFRDRVVHHAIVNVLDPVFDPTLIADTYACRRGKGNHAAMRRLRDLVRGDPRAYALKCDVSRYFASVDHAALLGLLERKVKDRRVLDLCASLVAATPVDPAFGPGRGIPIGNLTSQMFANLYLSPLDGHAKQVLGLGRYLRYVDDIVALDGDKRRLHAALASMEAFAAERLRLAFHPRKSIIAPVRCGVDFVGFVVSPARVRVRRAALVRFRRRERGLRRACWRGELAPERYWRSVESFAAHAAHADAHRLLATMGLQSFRPQGREGGRAE